MKLHDVAAYGVFGIATEEHAMGQDARTAPRVGLHAADEMEQEGEVAALGRGQQVGVPTVVEVALAIGGHPVFL